MDMCEQILIHDLTTAVDLLKDYATDKHRLHMFLFNFGDGCESYEVFAANFCLKDPYADVINKMVKYHKNFSIHRIRGVCGAWNAYYIDVVRENGKWDLVSQDVIRSFGVPENMII